MVIILVCPHIITVCGHPPIYHLDTGACEEIIKGNIKVRSASGIETFTRRGLRLSDGSELDADVVIYATG